MQLTKFSKLKLIHTPGIAFLLMIMSDDEDHIYTRIPKYDSSFSTDPTLQENYSTLKKSPSNTPQGTTSARSVQTNSPSLTH